MITRAERKHKSGSGRQAQVPAVPRVCSNQPPFARHDFSRCSRARIGGACSARACAFGKLSDFLNGLVGPHMDCGSEVPIGWRKLHLEKNPESWGGRARVHSKVASPFGTDGNAAASTNWPRVSESARRGAAGRGSGLQLSLSPTPVNINKRCSLRARNSSDWTAERGASGQSS